MVKSALKKIGIEAKAPEKECNDSNCPFHGANLPRGRTFVGTVLSTNMHKTATVEWHYRVFIPKFERHEKRRTKIHVHNPACINAKPGDIVKIAETRPISKTKNFAIIENLGKEKLFKEKLAAREEAKAKEKETKEAKKAEKEEAEENAGN